MTRIGLQDLVQGELLLLLVESLQLHRVTGGGSPIREGVRGPLDAFSIECQSPCLLSFKRNIVGYLVSFGADLNPSSGSSDVLRQHGPTPLSLTIPTVGPRTEASLLRHQALEPNRKMGSWALEVQNSSCEREAPSTMTARCWRSAHQPPPYSCRLSTGSWLSSEYLIECWTIGTGGSTPLSRPRTPISHTPSATSPSHH